MQTSTLRYQFPKKAIKSDCPQCGPKHRRTFSLYIDTRTGETLPEAYGRCDRESNCGYHLSPYQKGPSGMSYADMVFEQWKADNPLTTKSKRPFTIAQPLKIPSAVASVYSIPDLLFESSIGHYERNKLAFLLYQHFGVSIGNDLLERFRIGTSSRWSGACVFWYIDEQNRKRGGQIKLFGDDWHTVKYVDRDGRKRTKTDWVHSAYAYRCDQKKQVYPDWLQAYIDQREFSPCLFGLSQLLTTPSNQAVAIVEAPKTAILCTPYFPQFVWLAIGALSYLNVRETGLQRMAPLKGRNIVLFPDLSKNGSTYAKWRKVADELQSYGFQIVVSDYLEQRATDEGRIDGLDLADYLLDQWKGYPPDWD